MGLLTPLAVRVGAISWLPHHLPKIVKVDKAVQRLTSGRLSLLDVAGVPNLLLTVPGRKSGVPRSTPLLCVPSGDSFLVAGSYFGGPKEPLWVANLDASPPCEITQGGHTVAAVARRVEGEERERRWAQMLEVWPNYATYERRTNRHIKVFELTPTGQPTRPSSPSS